MDKFPPHYIDIFLSPIRDSLQAQGCLVGLLILIVLDILLGFAAACRTHAVKSSVMRDGIWHKVGELGLVAVAVILDGLLGTGVDLGFSAPITVGVIVYLCLMEAASCLENAIKLDPELKETKALGLIASALHIAGDGEGTKEGE